MPHLGTRCGLGDFHPENVKHNFWHHQSKIYSKAQTNDQGKNGPAFMKKNNKSWRMSEAQLWTGHTYMRLDRLPLLPDIVSFELQNNFLDILRQWNVFHQQLAHRNTGAESQRYSTGILPPNPYPLWKKPPPILQRLYWAYRYWFRVYKDSCTSITQATN